MCGGRGFAVPKDAPDQESSIDFLKYMMGEDAQKLLTETSGFSL